jgi:preprotein translocase subunit SecF
MVRTTMRPANNEVLISLPEQTGRDLARHGPQQIVDALQAHYDNPFTVRNVQVVGPTVGKQLEKQAGWPRSTRCWACWSTSGSASS